MEKEKRLNILVYTDCIEGDLKIDDLFEIDVSDSKNDVRRHDDVFDNSTNFNVCWVKDGYKQNGHPDSALSSLII